MKKFVNRNAHMEKFWPNRIRWDLLSALLCAISSCGYTAQVEGPLAVPKKWTTKELQQKAAEYFSAFEGGSATMLGTVLDPELHAQWFNLDAQISMAVGDRRLSVWKAMASPLKEMGLMTSIIRNFPSGKLSDIE